MSIAPDHRAVKLTLNPPHVKRGPGLWKFNNSLEDEKYVKVIREYFTCISEKYSNLKDNRLRWKLIKMELRGLTIPYAKNKAKNVRKKEMDVQKRLEELESLVSSDANTTRTNQLKIEYSALKEELRLIYENKGKGLI